MKSAWELISAIGVLVIFFGILGWLAWQVIRKAQDPAWIITKLIISFVFGVGGFIAVIFFLKDAPFLAPVFVLPIAIPLGLWWAPQIAAVFAFPLTSIFDGGGEEVEPKPLYSIARTQIEKGNYQRGLEEIRKQLDKFPNDYEGMMMLAELQAHQLNDFPTAEVTIQKVANNPKETPAHIADALHRLADWQLEILADPEAARETLQRIADHYPKSITAQSALERIAHLPTTEQLLNTKDRKALVLKRGPRNLGISRNKIEEPEDYSAKADKLTEHLRQFPDDSDAREQLAEIYSKGYERHDFAEEQLRLLINFPGHTQKQIARWLNRIADYQIASGKTESARNTLKEVMTTCPGTVYAEQAESRLMVLDREIKAKEGPHVIKLGAYKKNLGLSKDG